MRLIQQKRPLFLWLLFIVAISAAAFIAGDDGGGGGGGGVFEIGPIPFTYKQVNESEFGEDSPSKPLLIFTPTVNGKYPVLLFLHGTCLHNSYYSDVLKHISSHGYIIVAPQLYSCLNGATHEFLPISGDDELDYAAEIANWLPSGLKSVLHPENVVADLEKLSVGGHSRGGKIAYALALGYAETPLQVKISGLVGVSPVEGPNKYIIVKPKVLTNEPNSLNLTIPVVVTGSGLGDQPVCLWGIFCSPAVCSPDGLNHQEFFDESNAPAAAHFVAAEYGHMDMLNDDISDLVGKFTVAVCKSGVGPKDPMRRTIGGIIVGYLDAYFKGQIDEYMTIVEQYPSIAPVKLHPVQFKSSHANVAQV